MGLGLRALRLGPSPGRASARGTKLRLNIQHYPAEEDVACWSLFPFVSLSFKFRTPQDKRQRVVTSCRGAKRLVLASARCHPVLSANDCIPKKLLQTTSHETSLALRRGACILITGGRTSRGNVRYVRLVRTRQRSCVTALYRAVHQHHRCIRQTELGYLAPAPTSVPLHGLCEAGVCHSSKV